MNYVYLLRCSDGSLYCGWTTDVEARLQAHNSGHGAKYTRSRRPVSLAYSEAFENRQDALRREWEIKQMTKAAKETLVESRNSKPEDRKEMQEQGLHVRRAEQGDIPALLSLLLQVDLVHHEGRPDLFKGPATKYTGEELEVLLHNPETPVFVCADESGNVLGHCFCIFEQYGGTLMTERKTLYIDDICVDEKARGRGVGRAIYEHILRYAGEQGCYNLTLNVWTCNPGAMAFYRRLGLEPYKIGMEQILGAAGENGGGE